MATFSVWDYIVFIGMLMVSAGIGVYYRFTGGKQKTTSEYLMADRSMPIWPVSFSLMASFMSAITLLGVSNENYQFGTQFIVINISYGLATPIAAYLFLPVFFKLKSCSAYEYLEQRFGQATRLTASVAYTLQMILYMGIALFAPALALEAVTGLDKNWAIIIIGVVCTFYSTIGGMKAVLMTDVFQALLMFAAIYTIVIWTLIDAGGFGPIFQAAQEGGRLEFWNFSPDPTVRHSWWSLIIGGGFTYLSLYAVNQTQVQRLQTVKSLKKAQLALWWNWPILSLLSLSTSFSGLCLYYYYRTCDPVEQGYISSRDQVMPLFVVDALGHLKGLPGLFVSGIFSASLSSISAAVNSVAAVVVEDYMKPLYTKITNKSIPESQLTLQSKLIALMAGGVCVGVAFLAKNLGGVLQASLTVFGVVGGPLFSLFSLGMFTTRANQRGVIPATLIGLAFGLWIGFGGPKPPLPSLDFDTSDCSAFERNNKDLFGLFMTSHSNETHRARVVVQDPEEYYFYLYRLSYLWTVVITYVVTFILGYLFSWLLELFSLEGESPIYEDGLRNNIKADLFVPPLAKKLRHRNAMNVSDFSINGVNGDKFKLTSSHL